MYFTPARLDLINFAAAPRPRTIGSEVWRAGSTADRGRDMDGRPRQMNSQRSRRDMPRAARFICHLWHPPASPRGQSACSEQNQRQTRLQSLYWQQQTHKRTAIFSAAAALNINRNTNHFSSDRTVTFHSHWVTLRLVMRKVRMKVGIRVKVRVRVAGYDFVSTIIYRFPV